MITKRFTYVVDNGKDTIYDLSPKGIILENFIDIEETMNNLDYENQQLTIENAGLRKELDYIQDSITEAIANQKTDIAKNALREVIRNYNMYMLGHRKDGVDIDD